MSEENSWGISVLDGKNHDSWFSHFQLKLRGKEVYYVVTQTLINACRVVSSPDNAENFHDPILNIDKKEKYLRDEGTAIDLMFRSLSLDDQALYDEYDSAFSLWAYLRSKYQQTDSTTANEYMTLIQNFSFNDMTIIQGWDKLNEYRRKLCAADMRSKHSYQDEALLLILIRSLPKEYVATIDTLDAITDLSVEEKLKRLQTKESRLISSQRNENAFPSFQNDKTRSSRELRTTPEQSEDSGYSPLCYLCGRRHFIKACPFMEIAQDAVHEYIRTTKSIRNTPKQRDSGRSSLSQARSPSQI